MAKSKNTSPIKDLEAAIERVGSASELARALGVSRQAIFQWRAGERPIPLQRIEEIRRLERPLARAA